jgi:AraC-like DNA-binding protein
LNSEKNINEIAFDLGFEYPQYFNKLFKKKTGKTPMEYRNLN